MARFQRLSAAAILTCALHTPTLDAQQPDSTLARDSAVAVDPLAVTVFGPSLAPRVVPYAVTIVPTRAAAEAAPGLSLASTLAAVPGVQVDNRYNYALGERISIRGFGARAQFGVRGVAIVLDGVPLTLADGQSTLSLIDPALIGRAEIVRGPASALFGNAAGGAIELTSRPLPSAGAAARLRLLGGADGWRRYEASAGWGGASGAFGVDASRIDFDGFRAHAEATVEHALARGDLRLGPGTLDLALAAVRYDALNPGSLSDSLLRVDRDMAFATNVRDRTGESAHQVQASGRWQAPIGRLASELSVWGHLREIDNPIPFRIIDLERLATGARALLSGDAGPVTLSGGAQLERQQDDRLNFRNERGARGALVLDQRETVTASALFARAIARLGDQLRLLGAFRYDRHRFEADDRLVTALDPDESGSRVLDAWSPSVGASFAATDALTLFANLSTAFETPTTSELANRADGAGGFNPELEPQHTTAFEGGAKGLLHGVAWEATAYRARVEDALIPFEVAAIPGRQYFRNAGSAIHRGIEVSAQGAAGRWRGRVAYGWTDARFEAYRVDDDSFDGNRVPGVAPHRLGALLSYTLPRDGAIALEARWSDAVPVNDANTAESPAYATVDARVVAPRLAWARTEWAPFLSVENLFGERYNSSVVPNAFGGRYYEPGPGRALYLGVTLANRR